MRGLVLLTVISLVFTKALEGTPLPIQRSFNGVGWVERVEAMPQGRCKAVVRVESWISLRGNFALPEIPTKGKRFAVYMRPEACLPLQVAVSEGLGIIARKKVDPGIGAIWFSAGQSLLGTWFFLDQPRVVTSVC